MAVDKKTEVTTTLDSDVTKPSVTAPGDGPADTTDPTEVAVSVTPQPGEEALAVGTVNAVKKVASPVGERDGSSDRVEKFKATRADGSEVTVSRNLETGVSTIK